MGLDIFFNKAYAAIFKSTDFAGTIACPARFRAGIFKKSMAARHRVGIGLSYRPVRLNRLAELMPWNRFMGSINVQKYGLRSERGTEEAPLFILGLLFHWFYKISPAALSLINKVFNSI